jgi:hypothetical protein
VSALFAGGTPRGFADLAERADATARETSREAANLALMVPRLADNMRAGLRALRGMRPQTADGIADDFVRRFTKIAQTLGELEGHLEAVAGMAESHRQQLRTVEVDERKAGRTAFRV